MVSTKEKLLPLFECFSLPVASTSNIPQLCLIVLSRLTTYAPCLEAMVADTSSLLILLQMLHSSPSCREGALHVLYALASTPELAWAAAKHGGVVFILEVLLPIQGMVISYMAISLKSFQLTSKIEILCRRDSFAAKSSSGFTTREACWADDAWA